MCYLRCSLKIAKLAEYQIALPCFQVFLNVIDALEPYQFEAAGGISYFSYKPSATTFTNQFKTNQAAAYLYVV